MDADELDLSGFTSMLALRTGKRRSFEGSLPDGHLPEAWNEESRTAAEIFARSRTMSRLLQDIHWPSAISDIFHRMPWVRSSRAKLNEAMRAARPSLA